MGWKHKTLGRIADEMESITDMDALLAYRADVEGCADAEKLEEAGLTPRVWFDDYVHFIAQRRTLPLAWYEYAGLEPPQ